ncbi:hypothetical protein ACFZCV_05405 [Streptomyces sp. NPDC007920]|uniref:hypothetical protein n=1 Tax=Streptomyces sp. NPDC007920 TaxID=3364794 RepID=UPI0036EA933B
MLNTAELTPALTESPAAPRSVLRMREILLMGAPKDMLDTGLAEMCDELGPGMSQALREGLTAGLNDRGWDDAVAAFGDLQGSETACYLGPMRAREKSKAGFGLLYAERDDAAAQVVSTLESTVDDLGEALFGFSCSFHGRKVEFYDLRVAAGPLTEFRDVPIALFSPFYLEGWEDTERQLARRRTILLTNVVTERFRRITAKVLEAGIRVDGKRPALLDADETELRRAVPIWLSLHELMHGSGPMPFFASWSGKDRVADYSAIEEARVDMSGFLAADLLAGVLPGADLARELIAAERLFRSARSGLLGQSPGTRPKLDDAHGLYWLSTGLRSGAVAVGRDGIDVDLGALGDAARSTLGRVYEVEQQAADSQDPEQHLRQVAGSLHSFMLPSGTLAEFAPVRDFFQRRTVATPTGVKLSR